MILSELLQRTKPVDLEVTRDAERSYRAKAKFGNREIEYQFGKWPPPNDNRWNFTFVELGDYEDGETFAPTGNGNQLEIFATAKHFLETVIKKFQPKVIYFEADKKDGKGRVNLYKRFTDRWVPPGYKHRIVADADDAVYHAYVEEKLYKQLYQDKEKES